MGGKELLVSCSDDFTLCLWDPEDGKKPINRMTGHQAIVNHLSFSPGARRGVGVGVERGSEAL
jgi:ribosome assembly protein 4